MTKPKAIDLFSGCGGLTLGLKQAGFRVVGAVEIDDLAVETYQMNHPEVRLFRGDIRLISPQLVMKELGLKKCDLDLLVGCPPCQGFSTLRTRKKTSSVDDPRNDLLYDFIRFVKEIRPKAVMMENVPGLAGDERFGAFQSELRGLGYLVEAKILDAAGFGVPQRRRRLIAIAGRNQIIPLAKPGAYRYTVRETIGYMPEPGDSGDPLHDLPEKRSERVMSLIRKVPKNGGSRGDLGEEDQLDCHRRCNGFKDIYGRMAWDDVSPTITGGCVNPSKGRFLHPEQDRCITLREAALLQGFPMSYRFSLRRGKFPAAQMIGNALPPELIKRQAAEVIAYLRG